MKLLRKALYYLIITTLVLVSSAVIATFIYKEEIINLLKTEVNKRIKTELKVDQIDLKLIKGFPNISVEFQGVQFYSAFENELLLEGEQVYFVLNVLDLFNENIVVERLEIIDAVINISINKLGEKNFDVFVVSDSSETGINSLNLKSILFKNVVVNDTDVRKKIKDGYQIESLLGGLQIGKNTLSLKVNSSFQLVKTLQPQLSWLVNKNIVLNTKNEITKNKVSFSASTITIEKVKLNLEGSIGIDSNREVNLSMNTSNLKLRDLRSILPKGIQSKLAPYRGSGNINLKTTIKGKISEGQWPGLNAQVVLKDFEINHNELLSPVQEINLTGEVLIANINDLRSGLLSIENLTAKVDNNNLEISGQWNDFINPSISGSIKGSLGTSWLLSFLGGELQSAKEVKGGIAIDMSGAVKLDKSFTLKKSEVIGKLNFDNVSVGVVFGLPLTGLKGELIFDNEDIKVNELTGNFGESDLSLNGTLTLPNEGNKRLYSKLDIQSNFINLDEIVSVLTKSIDSTSSTSLSNLKYSTNLHFNIDRLTFLKFRGKELKVNLTVDEKIINVNSAFAEGLGGEIFMKGIMTEQFNGDHYVKVSAKTKHINLDSLFYVFGNFKQSFITSEAVKGKLDANVYTYMYFGSDWSFKRKSLYSEASLRVSKGKLINYKPVMSLAEYLNEEGENLSQLKFSELENHIIISNDTVFISEMYVGTNVRNIKIGGYHTLNQHIDYRLAVPVINDSKDKDTQFGKVKSDKSGQLYFPFRVYGTTSDYKVVYDLKTASSNFIKGVKKEIKGLGKALTGKDGDKISQDTLELEDDEFFDWDGN